MRNIPRSVNANRVVCGALCRHPVMKIRSLGISAQAADFCFGGVFAKMVEIFVRYWETEDKACFILSM